MAQYLYVDNYASGGQLGISVFTFNQLAGQAIHRVILRTYRQISDDDDRYRPLCDKY